MSDESSQSVVSASVPKSFKKELRVEAAREDKAMADLMREALHEWSDERDLDDDLADEIVDGARSENTPTAPDA